MKANNIVILLISLLNFSCSNELDKRIKKINYGTSFGECVGYCRKQMSVASDSVHFTAFCDACMTPSVSRKDLFSMTTKTEWDSIQNFLPLNSFFIMPTVIGCPDCADGGAEWLELILINGETHKVTFEFGKEPSVLKDYIVNIRKIFTNNNSMLN